MRRVTLDLPEHLVRDARLFSAVSHDLDAVCRVLEDYGRIVAECRQLRRRLDQLDREGSELDTRLERLQAACRAILDL